MFIYTAAYIINKVYGHDIYILDLPNKHSNIDYIHLFKYKKKLENTDLPGKIVGQSSVFSTWDNSYKPQIILYGYFQYYPAIKPREDDIRSYFKYVLSPYIKDITSRYNTENTGFIHIRRGDYLTKSHYHYIQPIEYYEKALQIIKEKPIRRFYLLTDDPSWVKTQDLFRSDNYILFNGNELETLALMTLCKSAAICANSSFSWWGAFLGSYEMRNPVIVPEKWINEPQAENLIPQEWIRI
jgi:hypothetical protein